MRAGEAGTVRLAMADVPPAHSQLHVLVSADRPAGWEISGDGTRWQQLHAVQGLVLDLRRPVPEDGRAVEAGLHFRPEPGPENRVAPEVGIGYILSGDFKQHE